MRRLTQALLGSMLLCAATAASAAAQTAPADPVRIPAMAAVASPASPADLDPLTAGLPGGAQSVLTPICPPEPVTTCTSCLYFGIPSSYSCTIFCFNGVPHRSCDTCGQGCNL